MCLVLKCFADRNGGNDSARAGAVSYPTDPLPAVFDGFPFRIKELTEKTAYRDTGRFYTARPLSPSMLPPPYFLTFYPYIDLVGIVGIVGSE